MWRHRKIMKYIFLSQFVATAMKGKKQIQIVIAAFLLLIPTFNLSGILNFILGKKISFLSVLSIILFVYFLMNLLYAIYSKEELESPVTDKLPANPSDKANKSSIIRERYYGGEIKTSPRENQVANQDILRAPIPTVILDKAPEKKETPAEDSGSEPEQQYSGELNQKSETNISNDVIEEESPLPEKSTALFNKISKTQFFNNK